MKMTKKCMIFTLVNVFLAGAVSLQAREISHFGKMVDGDDPIGCLSCHYKKGSEAMATCTGGCLINPSTSHPIFKKYPPKGKEAEYVPLAKVKASGVKLRNDEITCISCHDIGRTIASQLI